MFGWLEIGVLRGGSRFFRYMLFNLRSKTVLYLVMFNGLIIESIIPRKLFLFFFLVMTGSRSFKP